MNNSIYQLKSILIPQNLYTIYCPDDREAASLHSEQCYDEDSASKAHVSLSLDSYITQHICDRC